MFLSISGTNPHHYLVTRTHLDLLSSRGCFKAIQLNLQVSRWLQYCLVSGVELHILLLICDMSCHSVLTNIYYFTNESEICLETPNAQSVISYICHVRGLGPSYWLLMINKQDCLLVILKRLFPDVKTYFLQYRSLLSSNPVPKILNTARGEIWGLPSKL